MIIYKKKEKFKFKLEFEGEGNIKKPRVVASVINTIKPNKVTFKIKQKYGTCGEIVEEIVLYLENKNINYTTYIDFNTNLTNINETIIANFDQYHYSIGKYEIEDSKNNYGNNIEGISISANNNKCTNKKQLKPLESHIEKEKDIDKIMTIPLI